MKTAFEFYQELEKLAYDIKLKTWGQRIKFIVQCLAEKCEELDNECAILNHQLKIAHEKIEDLKDYLCNEEAVD